MTNIEEICKMVVKLYSIHHVGVRLPGAHNFVYQNNILTLSIIVMKTKK